MSLETRLAKLTPEFLKPLLRPLYRGYLRLIRIKSDAALRPRNRAVLHDYWKEPWDGKNLPEGYLTPQVRSEFLAQRVEKYIDHDAKILEIGCNVGRN